MVSPTSKLICPGPSALYASMALYFSATISGVRKLLRCEGGRDEKERLGIADEVEEVWKLLLLVMFSPTPLSSESLAVQRYLNDVRGERTTQH